MAIIPIKDENHWHELRRQHVGASDVAALFPGAGGFKTHFELYMEKSGRAKPEQVDNERVDIGKEFEWAFITAIAKREGWILKKPEGYYTHPTVKGMGCTPDAIAIINGEEHLIEVKVVDYQIFKSEWTDGEPPLKYLFQKQHQLACCPWITKGKIVAYVVGASSKIYGYERHENTIASLEDAVRKLWQDIEEGNEPEITDGDYDIIRSMNLEGNDLTVDLNSDNELPEICSKYQQVNKMRLDIEKEENRLKAKIIHKIGGYSFANTTGFFISYPEITKNMQAKEAYTQKYRQLKIK